MDKKITAIAVVVIVIVAAVAAVALTRDSGNGGEDGESLTIEYTAKVYGNANNDAYIDQSDLDMVQDIIDGVTIWNSEQYPYADANNDSRITNDDYELIQKIINDESCEVWYTNGFGVAQQVPYPLVNNKIALTYWQQGELVSLLGHWDEVVAVNESIYTDRANLYDLSNIQYHFGTTTGSSVTEANCEMLEQLGVDLVIASPYTSNSTPLDAYLPHVTKLYINPSGFNCISDALTLGILMDSEEQAESYVEFSLGALREIRQAMATIPEDEIPTMIITRMYEDNDSYIQRYGGILVNVASTDGVYQILSLLANCYQDNSDLSTTPHRSLEWFLQNDFDYILDLEVYTGFKPSDTTDEPFFTQQEYNDRFENSVEYFRGTSAYENGNVITASYNLYGGYSSFAALKIIASMLYPDLFTLEEGQADLQYWYDNFTTADIDVTVDGGYIYTGDWPN